MKAFFAELHRLRPGLHPATLSHNERERFWRYVDIEYCASLVPIFTQLCSGPGNRDLARREMLVLLDLEELFETFMRAPLRSDTRIAKLKRVPR